MASVVGATGVQNPTAASTLTADAPASLADGDVLLAVETSDTGDLTNMLAPDSSWGDPILADTGGSALHLKVWAKTAASEPASWTFSNDAGADWVMSVVALRGVTLAGVVSTIAVSQEAETLAAPSLDGTTAGAGLLVCIVVQEANNVAMTWTPPAGMVEQTDVQSTTWNTHTVATLIGPPAPTGAQTFTASTGAVYPNIPWVASLWFPDAGGTPAGVTGTIAGTLPALTGSLTGTSDANLVTGTISGTLPALTGNLTGTSDVTPANGPFVTGVSGSGRYFVDGTGQPILVRGDSPWAMFTKLSPIEMDTYLANRASYGTNLLLVSMVGAVANGAPSDDGATFDGILPFTGGDPTVFNEAYWSRMDTYIAKARDQGIALMIYPMDGWNTTFGSTVFNPGNVTDAQCRGYGQALAARYAAMPHILWAFGGDYNEDATINSRYDACLQGIRAAGDTAPATIQLLYDKSLSSDSAFWETRVDFNFVYTYYVTYKAVEQDGYQHTWPAPTPRPALFGEGAYENSFQPHPGSDLVIRRQACWALTSGSPGEFTGQEGVWNFQSGWQTLLDTTAAAQLQAIRDTFAGLAWWTLVPDDGSELVTGGRGARVTTDAIVWPSDNAYVTAARAPDASLAVAYLPDATTAITVDTARIGANPTATWVDPTNGQTTAATFGSSYSHPAANAAGDSDWLLVLTGDPVPPVTGSIGGTLPALTGQFTGTVGSAAAGALTGVLPALTGHLDGTLTATGALDGTLPALVGSLDGTVTTPAVPVTGTITGQLPALTGRLTGTSGQAQNRDITVTAALELGWATMPPTANPLTAGQPTRNPIAAGPPERSGWTAGPAYSQES